MNTYSPHTFQYSYKNDKYEPIIVDEYLPINRICNMNILPPYTYQPRSNQSKSTFHYGQRKLLLTEIEFLTLASLDIIKYYKTKIPKFVVVYAGSAPGLHAPLIFKMFPQFQYIYVDPTKFMFDVNKYPNVKTFNRLFTDKFAHGIANRYKHVLFISDIRSANHKSSGNIKAEIGVSKDMNAQKRWYHILNPFRSMLKFRPPYESSMPLAYLNGVIYYQPWAGQSSAETRLHVKQNANDILYDCIKYENKMYSFNNYYRVICYKHDIHDLPGIDECYDCRTEIYILEQYIKYSKLLSSKFNYKNNKYKLIPTILYINRLLNADNKKFKISFIDKNVMKHYMIPFYSLSYGTLPNDIFQSKYEISNFVIEQQQQELIDDE